MGQRIIKKENVTSPDAESGSCGTQSFTLKAMAEIVAPKATFIKKNENTVDKKDSKLPALTPQQQQQKFPLKDLLPDESAAAHSVLATVPLHTSVNKNDLHLSPRKSIMSPTKPSSGNKADGKVKLPDSGKIMPKLTDERDMVARKQLVFSNEQIESEPVKNTCNEELIIKDLPLPSDIVQSSDINMTTATTTTTATTAVNIKSQLSLEDDNAIAACHIEKPSHEHVSITSHPTQTISKADCNVSTTIKKSQSCKDFNNVMYSSPCRSDGQESSEYDQNEPLFDCLEDSSNTIQDNDVECIQLDDANELEQNNIDYHSNGQSSINYQSNEYHSDSIIDVDSEEELEITASIQSPRRQRKRGRGRPSQGFQTPTRQKQINIAIDNVVVTPRHNTQMASGGRQKRLPEQHRQRNNQQLSNAKKRLPPTNNCQSNPSNRLGSMPKLPRNLLRYSSQESDSDDNYSPRRDINQRSSFPVQGRITDNEISPSQSSSKQVHSTNSLTAPTRKRQRISQNSFSNQIGPDLNSQNNHFQAPSTVSNASPKRNILNDRTCTICKHTFPNLTLARQHAKQIHSSPNQASQTNPNQLQSSPLQTRNSMHASPLHMNTAHDSHLNVNPTHSSRIHANTISTSQNQAKASPGMLFTCQVCSGMFTSNKDLKSHMLLHDNHQLFKCNVCSCAFKQRSVLTQHMRIHSEELPYNCSICNKQFRQQAHLILHMGKHAQNNEGVYSCPHCIVNFTNEREFTKHMRQHDANLPFGCESCQERFNNKTTFLIHLEEHNNGRCFTCHICKKSFKTKTYLHGHMQMHKVQEENDSGIVSEPPPPIIKSQIQ